ncbi:hypothetical protein CANCADRAFT_1675 [Tortispora caseinolytica NRRL Y-17796]|uniref:Uncharacterized protein n=1 Tax=Tortispora caseinolytica NRRL Y-17796 TaxID=767744 RepID=A0A1E4TDW6_9ASCO|nr:hypothetical protein CANCADRAFT_1675 [Tortispora caseinolytica NRRL Y-17796]
MEETSTNGAKTDVKKPSEIEKAPTDVAMTELSVSTEPEASVMDTSAPTTANETIPAKEPSTEPEVDMSKPNPAAGGAPVRRYLNAKVTPVLLEGMRKIAREQPENPLRSLGEYLIARSE